MFRVFFICIFKLQVEIKKKKKKVFTIDDNRIISMIKVRVVQAMIQIARPVAWGVGRIRALVLELKCIELYLHEVS